MDEMRNPIMVELRRNWPAEEPCRVWIAGGEAFRAAEALTDNWIGGGNLSANLFVLSPTRQAWMKVTWPDALGSRRSCPSCGKDGRPMLREELPPSLPHAVGRCHACNADILTAYADGIGDVSWTL